MKIVTYFLTHSVPLWAAVIVPIVLLGVIIWKNYQINALRLLLQKPDFLTPEPIAVMPSEKEIFEEQEKQRETFRRSIEHTLTHWRQSPIAWSTMYHASNYYNEGVKIFNPVIEAFEITPLASVLTITEKKTQIIWDDNRLCYMLKIVEGMAQKNDDRHLSMLIQKLTDFFNVVHPLKNYRGYDSLIEKINQECPTAVLILKQNTKLWPV